jgi:hypothetical protein
MNVQCLTGEELLTCNIVELTSSNDWNPYDHDIFSPQINQLTNDQHYQFDKNSCSISDDLMNNDLPFRLISAIQLSYP